MSEIIQQALEKITGYDLETIMAGLSDIQANIHTCSRVGWNRHEIRAKTDLSCIGIQKITGSMPRSQGDTTVSLHFA